MDMTPLQQFIDESQKICDAATKGPWEAVRSLTCGHLRAAHNYCGRHPEQEWTAYDMVFIDHARTALPAALQHLRAATETIDGMRAQVEHLMAQCSEKDSHSALLTRRVAELEGQVRCGWGGGPKP